LPEEKIFVIPLGRSKKAARHRRARSATKIVREFLKRHTGSNSISLDAALNQKLWERGIKKPPSKIRVKAVKDDDGLVNASLVE
jgi:large subunit ribosomal protein L31e